MLVKHFTSLFSVLVLANIALAQVKPEPDWVPLQPGPDWVPLRPPAAVAVTQANKEGTFRNLFLSFSYAASGQTKEYRGKNFSFRYPAELSLSTDGDAVALVLAQPAITLHFRLHTARLSGGWTPWKKQDAMETRYEMPFLDEYEAQYREQARQSGAPLRIERMYSSMGSVPEKYVGVAVHAAIEYKDTMVVGETTVVEVGRGKYLAVGVIANGWAKDDAFQLRNKIMDTLELH